MSKSDFRRSFRLGSLFSVGGAVCLSALFFTPTGPAEAQPSWRTQPAPAQNRATTPPPRQSNPRSRTTNQYVTPEQFQQQQQRQQYQQQQQYRENPHLHHHQNRWYDPYGPSYNPYVAPQYPGPNAPLPPPGAFPPSPYYGPYGPGGYQSPYYQPGYDPYWPGTLPITNGRY